MRDGGGRGGMKDEREERDEKIGEEKDTSTISRPPSFLTYHISVRREVGG